MCIVNESKIKCSSVKGLLGSLQMCDSHVKLKVCWWYFRHKIKFQMFMSTVFGWTSVYISVGK